MRTFDMRKSLALLLLLPATYVASVEAARALPPLVDGTPWHVKSPDGMSLEMTFRPDGTGQIKIGLISKDITWAMDGENFCIGGLPVGTICMALSIEGAAVIGNSPDGKRLVFSRA